MPDHSVATAPPADKLAMSRALGAAFLNHQVQQLEKSVQGASATNWRERKPSDVQRSPRSGGRRGGGITQTRTVNPNSKSNPKATHTQNDSAARANAKEESAVRKSEDSRDEKVADIVVVDASVLVHALGQLKSWCREGRDEIIIIPLEALNTLDALKKGTSLLAQRARTASRTLEAQVGMNPRIQVQRDDAFVPWDAIPLAPLSESAANPADGPVGSPEWLRRVICCARWEVDHAKETIEGVTKVGGKAAGDVKKPAQDGEKEKVEPKVVLAVLVQVPSDTPTPGPTTPPLSSSPNFNTGASPIPLPSKLEPRSAGTLVAQWAKRASIPVHLVAPAAPPTASTAPGRHAYGGSDTDEHSSGYVHGSHALGGHGGASNRRGGRGGGRRRRDSNASGGHHESGFGSSGGGGGGLVERPAAVMALTNQPTKVIRVLARGEKLDP